MIKTRFAATPNGYLHVGNARIALANFLFARHTDGRFLLRFDDADEERSKPQHVESISQDLHWLGVDWDHSLQQSERLALYRSVAEKLKTAGRLYPCFESEDELRSKRDHRLKRGQPPVYDRAMLKMTAAQRAQAEAGGKRPYWRFLLSDRVVEWHDIVLGSRDEKLQAVSDPVLIRSDGTPLTTFTSVIDDIEAGISHVIRDEAQVTNTAIQLDLFAALGTRCPSFAHLPTLAGDESAKPTRRIDTLSLRSLRADGIEPAAVAAWLASLWTPNHHKPLPIAALAENFDLALCSRSEPSFDATGLLALNRRVLRDLPFAAVADRLPGGATESFWLAVRGNLDLLNEARGWWDVVAGTIVPPVMDSEQEFLRAALETLPPEPWNGTVWATWTEALHRATGCQGSALYQPLRLALTGEDQGPDLHDLLPLIGRTRVANRLQTAAT